MASSDQPVSERFPELEVVIVSGYHEFRPVERTIVERIAAAYPTIAILPLHQGGHTGVDAVTTDELEVYESLGFEREEIEPEPGPHARLGGVTDALYRPNPGDIPVPDALQWRELPTPEREIRFVARELRIELAEGRDPDDLAVVVPGTEAYAGYVEDTFDTFDIPHVTTAVSRLDRTFTGSIGRDLLALAEPDPRAEDLTSLLANPLTDLVESSRADAITSAARRRDTVALDPVLDDVDADAKALIENLRTTLDPLRSGDVGAGIDALRRVLDETFHLEEAVEEYASGTDRAIERQAYDVVDDVLESFESLQDISSGQTPLALFTRAFDGVPIRVPQRATGGRIEVMGMLDARMRSFETVFVVGLTSEHFPPGTEQPNFFEEMTDVHPRFDTADERRLGRYLFATLVANADEVTLTTHRDGRGRFGRRSLADPGRTPARDRYRTGRGCRRPSRVPRGPPAPPRRGRRPACRRQPRR